MSERYPHAQRLARVYGFDREFIAEGEVAGILSLGHDGGGQQREQREKDFTRSHSELSPEADGEKGTASGRLGEWDSSESAARRSPERPSLPGWCGARLGAEWEHQRVQLEVDARFRPSIQRIGKAGEISCEKRPFMPSANLLGYCCFRPAGPAGIPWPREAVSGSTIRTEGTGGNACASRAWKGNNAG